MQQTSILVSQVLIVEDHPLYSDALAAALGLEFPGCRVVQASTLRAALDQLDGGLTPDLVMFDLKLPDVAGMSGFLDLRKRVPDTPILVVSSLASVELVQALMREGAAGFMPKDSSSEELRRALSEVVAGYKSIPPAFRHADSAASQNVFSAELHPKLAALTPQQQRVMSLICEGKPNKQIAYELDLAEATVKAHVTALLRRLGVTNRTQAALLVEAAQQSAAGGADDPDARAFLAR